MVKIENHTSHSETAATGEDKDERAVEQEEGAVMAETNLEQPPRAQSRTSDSRRCVVCSTEIMLSSQDTKLLSSLSEIEKLACSLISKTRGRLSEESTDGGVVCSQCMKRVAAFLSGVEISPPGAAAAAPRNVSSSSSTTSKEASTTASTTNATTTANSPSPDTGSSSTPPEDSSKHGLPRAAKYAIPIVVGGVTAAVAAPFVVVAAGFGAGGIAAGSLAASMMSSAWTTGLGVGVVSTLQSIGAAGMGAAGVAATAGAGAGVGQASGAVGQAHGPQERRGGGQT